MNANSPWYRVIQREGEATDANDFAPIRVEPHHVLIMGDNRALGRNRAVVEISRVDGLAHPVSLGRGEHWLGMGIRERCLRLCSVPRSANLQYDNVPIARAAAVDAAGGRLMASPTALRHRQAALISLDAAAALGDGAAAWCACILRGAVKAARPPMRVMAACDRPWPCAVPASRCRRVVSLLTEP